MAFWSTPLQSADPKRSHRFTLSITGLDGESIIWYAKSVQRPSFEVSAAEHKYLNHTFYFPGSVTWNAISATVVDPSDPDAAKLLHGVVEAAGYGPPQSRDDLTTISKNKSINALGDVIIKMYDSGPDAGAGSGGATEIEKWTLKNAFITSVNPSELSYDNDELSTIEISFRYDWAECETRDGTVVFDGP